MKNKLYALVTGIIFSFQIICTGNIVINASEGITVTNDRTIYIEDFSPTEEPMKIELCEGEVIQLEFSEKFAISSNPDIRVYSNDFYAAVTQDLKLIGYNSGEGMVSIYFGDDWVDLDVNVTPSENIADENRAEFDRLHALGEKKGNLYIRKQMQLLGVINENAQRLDMETVEEIIDTSDNLDEIIKRFDRYHYFPDLSPLGEATTKFIYWFDEKGKDQIVCCMENNMVYYQKIADNGTIVGAQILYPQKDEFHENTNIYDDIYYIEYNQIPPEGDVNGDGIFNVADAVTFRKWLNGSSNTEIDTWITADFCEDDVLDSFDLCVMKQKLINSTL